MSIDDCFVETDSGFTTKREVKLTGEQASALYTMTGNKGREYLMPTHLTIEGTAGMRHALIGRGEEERTDTQYKETAKYRLTSSASRGSTLRGSGPEISLPQLTLTISYGGTRPRKTGEGRVVTIQVEGTGFEGPYNTNTARKQAIATAVYDGTGKTVKSGNGLEGRGFELPGLTQAAAKYAAGGMEEPYKGRQPPTPAQPRP